ncbi:Inner membrane protein YiaV precursor [Rubripirellula lacrimiformis]|uniref:Inner membrane protein YiaV n=1 Tax=Rubripirellula lacrimiformis TaxID=1930273 RepID=A0A517NFS4_9BACT|nr:HlyD family secretion protein [Rubripirellula lacrimiformis]QDT05977.1 Inner membrane protein YiaV precursor [Rubripirellula lacrimiformis]
MDLLIILTYAAIVFAIFKVFKVPVNGYTIVTAALGGCAILATLLLLMNFNHPYTKVGRFYFHTTPIVPQVKGKVIEVAVTDSQHVKAGDVLFKIDPVPYQAAVKQKQSLVANAKQRASELDVDLVSYQQAYQAAKAERDAAKDTYDRNKELVTSSAVSRSEFEQSKQSFFSADARANQAKAQMDRAEIASLSKIDGVNTDVLDAEAQLQIAQFNLDETTVRAPTDGTVLQVMLRPGMMAVPMPLAPAMIFRHDEDHVFVASFLQNNAQRIELGAEVEVILPAVPGRFFKGTVQTLSAAVAQGQLQPTGNLVDADQIQGEGRYNVGIAFDEGELDGFPIVPGSTGQVAVYSEHMHHLSVMRRVLMRMKSWTNYVFSDGH